MKQLLLLFILLTVGVLYAQNDAYSVNGVPLETIPNLDYDCQIDCDNDGCFVEYVSPLGSFASFIYPDPDPDLYVDPSLQAEMWVSDQFHARILAQSGQGFMLQYNGTRYLISWSTSREAYILYLDGYEMYEHTSFSAMIRTVGQYKNELTTNQ